MGSGGEGEGGSDGGNSAQGGGGASGTTLWERAASATIFDLEPTADGALMVYAVGDPSELESAAPVPQDPNQAFVARLSAEDGHTEWVHPLPTAYIMAGHLLATASNGRASFPEYDGSFNVVEVAPSGDVQSEATVFAWGANDYDAQDRLWTPTHILDGGQATMHSLPFLFNGWLDVEGYALVTGTEGSPDGPAVVRAFELDGTTLRWEVSVEVEKCATCQLALIPRVLPDGSSWVYFAVADAGSGQADNSASVSFACGDGGASGLVNFDADGTCVRVLDWSFSLPAEVNLGFGGAGDELLVGRSLLNPTTGEVIDTFGEPGPVRVAATPYGPAIYTLKIEPHASGTGSVRVIRRRR